ncbi:uncharacterized protein LOC6559283 isoform X2 [Drosophila grimshawi]|nr:uncharacterized protein LOC6559283 isoform X2 [Drosophila grimshawi]
MDMEQLKVPLITNDEIGRVITNILLEIEHNGLENYVAIIAEKSKLNTKALMEIKMVTGDTLPPIILDSCHLHKTFESMFCSKSARCLSQLEHEIFVENGYVEQLNGICQNYTQNVEADGLLVEYKTSLPSVLLAMWKIAEHRNKPISLARLNNDRLNAYSVQVQNDLPPITFEECSAGGGLLQLILFDALWCLCDGHEMEEESPKPTLDTAIPYEWLPLLN